MRFETVLLALAVSLPTLANSASPAQTTSILKQQILLTKESVQPPNKRAENTHGAITVGKVITYDASNYSPYNGAAADMNVFNAVFAGYSSDVPQIGVSEALPELRALVMTRMVKVFGVTPIPEADLICNLALSTRNEISGVSIGDQYFPLTLSTTSVVNGVNYHEYVAVPQNGPGFQQIIAQHAFCTTFESFNSTYPNGASVPVTLVP